MRGHRILPPLLVALTLAACGTGGASSGGAASLAAPATATRPAATAAASPTAQLVIPSVMSGPPSATTSPEAPCSDSSTGVTMSGTPTPPPERNDLAEGLPNCPTSAVAQGQAPSPLAAVTVVVQTAVVQSGGGIAGPPLTSLPSPTAKPPQSPIPVTTGVLATITDADNERTIQLAVGGTFQFKLDPGINWTITIDDQRVLAPVPNAKLDADVQGIYQALRAGRTELWADGEPACRRVSPPCMMPSILFHFTVVVQ